MSLLLEALKKAEKAKEDAQRRARDGSAGAEPAPSIFDSDVTVATDGMHVMRKDELPDISAPLEILSDDLRPSTQAKPAVPLELIPANEPPAQRSEAPRRAIFGRLREDYFNAAGVTQGTSKACAFHHNARQGGGFGSPCPQCGSAHQEGEIARAQRRVAPPSGS